MGEFHKRAFCKCGFNDEPPFGDVFHLHYEVCPTCGRSKNEMIVRTVRWVRIGWFKGEYQDRGGDPIIETGGKLNRIT